MKVTACAVVGFFLVLAISPSTGWLHSKLKKIKTGKAIPKTRALTCKSKAWHLYGHYCYTVFSKGKNFRDAEVACNDEGGHLASITSSSELKYLTGMMKKTKKSKKSKWSRYSRGINKAWVGLLFDESTNPAKMIWTDRAETKYRPRIRGYLGRHLTSNLSKWAMMLMGKKTTASNKKVETGALKRLYHWGGVGPEKSTTKLPYICKAEASVCPKGWRQWRKRCYRFFSKPTLSFGDAEKYCVKEHGHLASLHSDAQYEMLMNMIKTKKSTHQGWIGVIINHKSHSWAWTDKSQAKYLPQSSKLDAKPPGADVARLIYHRGKAIGLHDTVRSKKYGFICKIDDGKHNHGKHRDTTVAPKITTTVTFT